MPGGKINDYPSSPGPDSGTILVGRIQPETLGDIFLLSIADHRLAIAIGTEAPVLACEVID